MQYMIYNGTDIKFSNHLDNYIKNKEKRVLKVIFLEDRER